MSTGHRGPLRYANLAHPLDMAPLEAVNRVSQINGFQYYASDFIQWEGPNTAGEAGGWLLTETAAGVGNVNRVDIEDSAQFGILRLNTDNGDNDTEILEMVGEPWRYVVGKRLWFHIRCASSDANDGEAFFGLAISDTSPIATLPTDGLFFQKAETATVMSFDARKNGTSTQVTPVDTAAMADDVFHNYAFSVDVAGNVRVYYDDVQVGQIAAGNANLPNDEDLHVTLAFQTGAALTKALRIDHLVVAQER